MTSKKPLLLLALLPLLSLGGCLAWFEVEDVEIEPWQPTVAVPLIDSEVDIYDLSTGIDTAFINTQTSDLIEFVYQDTLTSSRLGDLVEIPDFSTSGQGQVPLPEFDDISLAVSTALSEILGEVPLEEGAPIPPFSGVSFSQSLPKISSFEEASFASGELEVSIRNNSGAALSFQLQIVDGRGNSARMDFNIAASSSQTRSLSLAGRRFGDQLRYEISNLSSPGSTRGYSSSSNLAFERLVRDMRFDRVTFLNNEEYVFEEDIVLPVDMPDNIELYTVALESGQVGYSLSSNIGIDLNASLTFSSAIQGGSPISQGITLSGGSGSGSIDLSGSETDFTQLDQGFNQLPAIARFVIPGNGQAVTLRQNNTVSYTAGIQDLAFSSLTGYLGPQELALGGDSVGISVFENTLSGAEVELNLVDPTLKFTVDNEYGVPFDFDMAPVYGSKNEGNSLLPIEVSPNPLSVAAGSPGAPSRAEVSVDNLNEIINFRPHSMVYDAGVRLNPDGRSVNAVDAEQRLRVIAESIIPLHGRLNMLSISDPIDADLSNDETLEDIQSLSLNVRIENEFPVELVPQFYFYNADSILMDSVFAGGDDNVFPAASVDSEGVSTGPSVTERTIQVRDSFLDSFTDTKSISLRIRLVTAEGGSRDVKILDSYKIRAQLGAVADVQVNP